MFFKNAINKKIVCITLCRPPPFLGCSAAEIRRVYSNLPYINLGKNQEKSDSLSDKSFISHFIINIKSLKIKNVGSSNGEAFV